MPIDARKPSQRATTSRPVKWLLLFCSVVLLSGCVVRVAYNMLDWLMLWKAEKLVNLVGTQEEEAKAALQTFHHWHRQTQLPLYIDYLTGFKARFSEAGFTGESIHAETDRIQDLMDLSLNQLMPDGSRILATLSDAQVEELLENLEEERQEFIDEYVEIPRKKQLKKRADDLQKHLTRWTGSLSREQKLWIQEWAQSMIDYEAPTATQQLQILERVAKLMAARSNTERLKKGLSEVLFYRTDNWDPAIQKIYDHNQALTYDLIARILNSLDDRQKSRFHKRLDNYIDDFRKLSVSTPQSVSQLLDPDVNILQMPARHGFDRIIHHLQINIDDLGCQPEQLPALSGYGRAGENVHFYSV